VRANPLADVGELHVDLMVTGALLCCRRPRRARCHARAPSAGAAPRVLWRRGSRAPLGAGPLFMGRVMPS
jgi:hypothetical protein